MFKKLNAIRRLRRAKKTRMDRERFERFSRPHRLCDEIQKAFSEVTAYTMVLCIPEVRYNSAIESQVRELQQKALDRVIEFRTLLEIETEQI